MSVNLNSLSKQRRDDMRNVFRQVLEFRLTEKDTEYGAHRYICHNIEYLEHKKLISTRAANDALGFISSAIWPARTVEGWVMVNIPETELVKLDTYRKRASATSDYRNRWLEYLVS
jgi:hypothetical protein